MLAVLCATEQEAKPLLDLADAVLRDESVCPVFSGSLNGLPLLIAVSGVGGHHAREACRHLVREHAADTVVNLGICGALTPGLEPGALLTVDSVIDGDRCVSSDGDSAGEVRPHPWPGLTGVSLATVSEPVFETSRRDRLAQHCGIVDMEGLAVADECRRLDIPCMMLKGVSDNACSRGRADLHKNLEGVSQRLAERFARDWHRVRPAADGVFRRLLRFTRVEHTVFSLPLLFAGAWLGAGNRVPSWRILALIAVVGTGARTFGMAMNRILDRDIDARNPRTAGRELPAGRLSLRQGYAVAALGIAVYLLGCAGLGRLCLILSPVPLIPLAGYTLLKRFTALCHFGIGLCLASAPLGAFVAASGRLPVDSDILLLSAFTLFWIGGFDIIYALQDIDADRALGVRSIPAALGSAWSQAIAAVSHLASVCLLVVLWKHGGQGIASGAALAVAAGAFVAAYMPRVPLPQRFFPLSAVAGIAGALVVMLSGLG